MDDNSTSGEDGHKREYFVTAGGFFLLATSVILSVFTNLGFVSQVIGVIGLVLFILGMVFGGLARLNQALPSPDSSEDDDSDVDEE